LTRITLIFASDTGIGMSPDELKTNLVRISMVSYCSYVTWHTQGTLAKSGTAEFLAKAESQDSTGAGNLIGKTPKFSLYRVG
jgi:heat shock protein 90kDa beta